MDRRRRKRPTTHFVRLRKQKKYLGQKDSDKVVRTRKGASKRREGEKRTVDEFRDWQFGKSA